MATQSRIKQTTNPSPSGNFVLAPVPAPPSSPVPPPTPALTPRRAIKQLFRLHTLGGQFAWLVLICLLLQGLGLAGTLFALSSTQANFQTVVNNSAPSLVAAQLLGQAVQDADAKAADYQLFSRLSPDLQKSEQKGFGTNGSQSAKDLHDEDWKIILSRRREVSDQLFRVRANINYPGEAQAIEQLTSKFLDYFGNLFIMKYELDLGHREAALRAYKAAYDVLVGNLNNVSLDGKGRSPEEQAKLNNWGGANFDITKPYLGIEANLHKLSEIDLRQLKQANDTATQTLVWYTIMVIVLVAGVVSSLLVLGLRYAFITHRLINPGYLLAMLGSLGLAFSLISGFLQVRQDYQTVSADSFLSIQAVATIRQVANDGNADESRFLLSPDKSGLDLNSPDLTPAVKAAFNDANLTESFRLKQAVVDSELKKAWANITYPGEKEALCEMTIVPAGVSNSATKTACPNQSFALLEYRNLDEPIRANFRNGQLTEAVKIDTGVSNDYFGKFDAALIKLSKINEIEFDKSACSAIGQTRFGGKCAGSGYLPGSQWYIWLGLPLLALLTLDGFWRSRRNF